MEYRFAIIDAEDIHITEGCPNNNTIQVELSYGDEPELTLIIPEGEPLKYLATRLMFYYLSDLYMHEKALSEPPF